MNDSSDDAWIADLVKFDEALRLGHRPAADAALAPELDATEQFLLRLQSVWPRTPQKIGPFTLMRSLGQGTIGPCYLVEQPSNRSPCVLKILWPDLGANDALRRRLKDVAEAMSALRCAGVHAVRDVRRAGPLCFVLLDSAPGPSLAQWRRVHPHPLPWQAVSAAIARLADRLDEVHRLGFMHGNLKPSNLFLPDGADAVPDALGVTPLEVSDLGIAAAIQDARLPSRMALPWPAPHYLAPEHLHHRSQRTAPTSDVYSLGVILYELLTSRSPVMGATREELLAQIGTSFPTPARQRRADLPAQLDALVMRCLHREPSERPATAQQLADDLRAVLPAPRAEHPAWWKQWLGLR